MIISVFVVHDVVNSLKSAIFVLRPLYVGFIRMHLIRSMHYRQDSNNHQETTKKQ